MEQSKTDLLMQFTLGKRQVPAESNLQIREGDDLTKGFTTATDLNYFSNFFEVSEFEMGMSLTPKDESSSGIGQNGRHPTQQTQAPTAGGRFASWRNATEDQYKKIPFRFGFDKFTFKRIIDSASPIFFQACCTSETFDSAILVKRVKQGAQYNHRTPAVGYLKIDFTKVLLVGVNWDDGDVVTESCEFICQEFNVTYCPQLWQGDLDGNTKMTAGWKQEFEVPRRPVVGGH